MNDRGAIVRLRRELSADLDAAAQLVAALSGFEERLRGLTDPVPLGYVAVTLHQIYTALETGFERIARQFEGSLPGGSDSHRALLRDMALDLPTVRPAVLRPGTSSALIPILKFRHFVRHAYAVGFDAGRLSEVLLRLQSVWGDVRADLQVFDRFLEALAEPP